MVWRVANMSATSRVLGIWRTKRQIVQEDKNEHVCCGKLDGKVASILVRSHEDAMRKLLPWNLGLTCVMSTCGWQWAERLVSSQTGN